MQNVKADGTYSYHRAVWLRLRVIIAVQYLDVSSISSFPVLQLFSFLERKTGGFWDRYAAYVCVFMPHISIFGPAHRLKKTDAKL